MRFMLTVHKQDPPHHGGAIEFYSKNPTRCCVGFVEGERGKGDFDPESGGWTRHLDSPVTAHASILLAHYASVQSVKNNSLLVESG